MHIAHQVIVQPARRVGGTLRVPGDKSISHRYALFAALALGRSTIHHYAPGGDCASTLHCLAALGVSVRRVASDTPGEPPILMIDGVGLRGLHASSRPLDCGNSGSTMRMLTGVVAAHSFSSTLTGDRSLSRRPMRRIIGPLQRMGAVIQAAPGDCPPLTITGAALTGIDFVADVPSAQVKSAVLLAGLQAAGRTRVTESTPTRDHTERALMAFGGTVDRVGARVELEGGQPLRGCVARVPGDLSSAAFAAVAAAALPGSAVTIEGVGLNPSRWALLDVLRRFGVDVEAEQTDEWQHEPVGRIQIRAGQLRSLELGPDMVPSIIDELPVLAVLATAGGGLRVTGASELRVKESDRITALVTGLRALGADADELPDGFHIRARRLAGGTADAHDDHRLAMAFAVAGLTATGAVTIEGADAAAVSYPSFFSDLDRLRA
ncbi:MAG: 3-phosphoshikimate 1-carboxyvinyltransferase [Acidobacteria bacterium]|nr:3-phosphoshikimate 1-carboxyvinyltransferase [Acidobacteriota bacterium]